MVTTATIEANSVEEAVAKVDAIHKAFGSNVDIDLNILADETIDERDVEKLGYAFNWLKNKAQEETNMAGKTGAIEYDIITDMTKLPQRIASAASAIENAGLAGASYKPIIYFGAQIVHGVKYWFFAEQTLITNPPQKRIVKMAVIEVQGKFEIVKDSIKVIHNIE
ncbi:MAG: hypothetical protein IKP64_00835 [Selenomonadaceae bacterium]|nr:hypothetical protein [Selenomonadaceae bacterium]